MEGLEPHVAEINDQERPKYKIGKAIIVAIAARRNTVLLTRLL
ncbi:MAG TPA: hypothetical protein VEH06_00005 [Candidatus Bathyarchaeia archaeon]|nr:hypothetical protein [Candidatus Bathyarchaeia archaeon]